MTAGLPDMNDSTLQQASPDSPAQQVPLPFWTQGAAGAKHTQGTRGDGFEGLSKGGEQGKREGRGREVRTRVEAGAEHEENQQGR